MTTLKKVAFGLIIVIVLAAIATWAAIGEGLSVAFGAGAITGYLSYIRNR